MSDTQRTQEPNTQQPETTGHIGENNAQHDQQPEQTQQSPAEQVPTDQETGGDSSGMLEQRLAQAEAQAQDFKDQWLRAVADYKNYKRRADNEREEIKRNANAGLLLKLLPIVDDLERSLANVPDEVAQTPWWEGTCMIVQKMQTLLESEGVQPIEAVGQEFDPNLHHAIMYEEVEGQDGNVVEELQKGYKIHDRVLRPTMVKVGKS